MGCWAVLRRGLGRASGALLVAAVLAGGLVIPARALPAVGSGPGAEDRSTAGHLDPALSAAAMARRTGRAVEVPSQESGTQRVFAQPNGTFRADISAEPFQVKRGGRWVPTDTTLRRGPGGVTPAATQTPLVLSGGGTMPLVSLGSGARRLDLIWPGTLPAPVLTGPSATYRGVRPGVDLRVTASVTGFTMLLVVADRGSGLRLLASPPRLDVTSPGLAVRVQGLDGLVAVDPAGNAVFAAPSARMWGATAGSDPARAAATAPVGLTLSGSTLTLHPDRAMVTGAATRYPVYIDPSFTASLLNWAEVLDQTPGGSFWNGQNLNDPNDPNGPIMVGLDPAFGTPARAFFQMNTASMNSKHILGATFRITEGWANSCTASEVDLEETGGISTKTTWLNQPSWNDNRMSSATTAHKTGNASCPAGQVAFNVTGAMQDAHNGNWPNLVLGLRATNEGNPDSWKRFQADATIQVDYNSVPTVGTASTSPATTCVSGNGSPAAGDPYVNDATPTLMAVASDADSSDNNETGHFAWQTWNGTAWVASGTAADPTPRAASTTTSVTTPPLADGIYRWQAQISQPVMSPYSGTDSSAWSSWCEFIVDTAPPSAPAVSSAQYPDGCAPCGGVGTTGAFSASSGPPAAAGFPPAPVTAYYWGFSDPPANQLAPSATGGITIHWTPATGGPKTLYVQSQDAAGNRSAVTHYQFTVNTPSPAAAHWLLNEPAGTSLTDITGNGNTAAVAGGTLGAPSRIVGVGALSLNGTSADYAQTTGPVVDTSQSYAVSAWVKLAATTGYQTVLGQDGAVSSGFQVQYDPSCTCWDFVLPLADATSPGAAVASAPSSAVVPGAWTQLTAVYDSGANVATLYVNGVKGTSTAGPAAPWNAGGAFAIGRSRWNNANGGYFNGSIADVQAWRRVLFPTEVAALASPSTQGPVALYHFDEVDSSVTFDSSPYARDLTLMGDASIPASGAGYQGTGMLVDDGSGYAASAGEVVHTDQSFTVSGWVRIDGSQLPAHTITAISQPATQLSGFYLGYRIIGSTPAWSFSMPGADSTSGVGWADAASPALTTSVLGHWVQLTGMFNAAANTMQLYVNGQLQATKTRTTGPWDSPVGNLMIGGDLWGPSGGTSTVTDEWTGAIDEVRLYAGIMPQALGNWQFDSCPGNPVACPDGGSGGHPLALGSGAAIASPGQNGSALSLNGSAVAATSGPVVNTSQSFTVGAWVNLAPVPANGQHVIVSQSGTSKSAFELQYDPDLGGLCFITYASDTTSAASAHACAGTLTAGQWTHVAGSYDVPNGKINLYINGKLTATAAFNSPWNATGALRMGAGYSGGLTAELSGQVDDVQVYSGVVPDVTTLM
jgi:hypothetical protein